MSTAPTIAVFGGKVVHQHLLSRPEVCIDLVKRAYLAHADKKSVNPDSYFLRFPHMSDARIIALPAWLGDGFDVAGLKWIASFPSNLKRGIPRASATLILNDDQTGYPIAIMESSIISAARTAASAVLGAQSLHGTKHVKSFAVVGCGLIARYVYDFLVRSGWTLDRVVAFDTTPGEGERFTQKVVQKDAHREVAVAKTVAEAMTSSDLVLLATTAGTPHLTDPALLAHRPTVMHLSLRDFSPELVLESFNVTDDVEHVMKAATSLHLAEQKVGHRRFVSGTIADLARGTLKPDSSRARLLSPFGMGILDLALGKWLYENARQDAVELPDFFYDLER